jgi:hypothetical protein
MLADKFRKVKQQSVVDGYLPETLLISILEKVH